MKQSICGPWMRYTFNNTDRGVECGYRRRSKTPCYNITLRARALATSAQCVFATANSFLRELNRFDAMTTWNFLRLLRRRSLNSKRRAIVITDNAKYHHAKLHSAWRQKNEGHFRLDYLPPYSPDLNPIERVWKLTRKLCIHDQYFPSIAAVITAVETQFAKWTSGNATLRRLCSI